MRVSRANMIAWVEVAIVAASTALALFLGATYHVAGLLQNLSDQAQMRFDLADFGPGALILASGLGVRSEARYRSLVDVSPAPILLTDANMRILFANDSALHLLRAGTEESVIGQQIAPFVYPEGRDHAAALYSRVLAGESIGPEEVRLRRLDGTDVVVQLHSVPAVVDGAPCVQSVLQDVTHLTEMADAMQQACIDTVEAMARLVETRDPYTAGHQKRVSLLAAAMAEHMGLPERTVRGVRIAGIVHDIGKINIPVEVLSKPGRLTDIEFELIKSHVQRGFEVLQPIEFPWPIAEIVRQHHERVDGSGYPRRLSDGDILLESRILAVADTVEAIASNRPYRPSLGLEVALRTIREGRGTLYDETCVDACEAVAVRALAAQLETDVTPLVEPHAGLDHVRVVPLPVRGDLLDRLVQSHERTVRTV
jgi:PAS domain S-box-containing protein/putative nucleotidyltransferase with HDIG domain